MDIAKLIVVEYSATTKAMYCLHAGVLLERNLKAMFTQDANDRKVIFVTAKPEDAHDFMDRMAEILANNVRPKESSEEELSSLTIDELMKQIDG